MTIDFASFTPMASLVGGVMIGVAALLLMLLHGRVMGSAVSLAALSVRLRVTMCNGDCCLSQAGCLGRWQ